MRAGVLATAAFGLMLAAVGSGCNSDDHKTDAGTRISTAQLIRYQEPDDTGPNPFTDRVDVAGRYRIKLPDNGPIAGAAVSGGAGPSGSNSPGSSPGSSGSGGPPFVPPRKWIPRVCDRYRLVKFLQHHPKRMRAWAAIRGLKPTNTEVRKYISTLHPVTLTRDTLVTAHTFPTGQLTTILKAGTPVLVDSNGRPVTNCTCGNPLTKPASTPRAIPAKCATCLPHYRLPPQCPFWAHAYHFDRKLYPNPAYDPVPYDNIFVKYANKSSFPFGSCYAANPQPPPMPLKIYQEVIEPAPPPAPPPPVYTPPQEPTPTETTPTETTPKTFPGCDPGQVPPPGHDSC